MSMAALDWAFKTALRGADKAVLLALATHANDDGVCWPGQEKLAAYAGVTVRTVRNAVAALVAAGAVTVEEETGVRTTYKLAVGAAILTPERDSAPEPTSAPETVSSTPEPISGLPRNVVPLPRKLFPPNHQETTVETSENHQRALIADRFEEFWADYPRKVGKGQARRAWAAAVKRVTPDRIIAAVRAARWNANPKYIPHPATWLNGERWADEADNRDPVLVAAMNAARGLMVGGSEWK